VRGVRRALLMMIGLTIFAGLLHAQEQEGRLVDRLLRPDLSLVNPQQNKKFVAAEGTSVEKKFEVKSYSATKERPTNSFFGIPDFLARTFGTKKFAQSDSAANAASSTAPTYVHTEAPTKKSALIKKSSQADKVTDTRDYPDNRPFLGKGTRQKILSQQDHPLSIDEVRELLNRDKPPTDSP